MAISIRTQLLAVIGSLLLCIGFVSAQAQQLTAEILLEPIVESYGPKYSDVQTAIDNLRSGNVEEARRLLGVAYDKNPDLPPPNVMLAQVMFQARKAEAGQAALQEATRSNPQDPAAFIYLGDLALQNRRLAEATNMYEKGVQLCKSYTANRKRVSRLLTNAYSGLSLLKESEQDWPQAKGLLEKVLENDPDNAVAMTRLGRVLFMMSKNQAEELEAYKVFQKVYELDPEKTARPEVNMALLYDRAGRMPQAESLMNKAVERDGNNVRTRLAVAKWAMDVGKLDMAKENARAASRIDNEMLEVLVYNGLIERFEGNYAAAEAAFREAHFRAPKHLGAMTQLALSLVAQDDEEKKKLALSFADLCVRVYPDLKQSSGREAAVVLAWCLSEVGQGTAATQAIARVVQSGSISADSAYYAAQIIFNSGQTTAAEKVLESALKNERAFPNRAAAEELMKRIKQN